MNALSRIIKYSILYYYKRLNYKILGILSLIVVLFSIKTLKEFIELNAENVMKKMLGISILFHI